MSRKPSKVKNFKKYIIRHWKVVFLLAIVFLATFSFSTTEKETTALESKPTLGLDMMENEKEILLDGYFESLPNDAYNLGLKFDPVFPKESDSQRKDEVVKLNIYLQGLNTDRQYIGSVTIDSEKEPQFFEKSFLAQGRYNQIVVQKDYLTYSRPINIVVEYMDRLNVHSDAELPNLKSTIYGMNDSGNRTVDSRLAHGASIVDLGSGNAAYHYSQSDSAMMLKDIFPSVDFDDDKAYGLSLDKSTNSIIAEAKDSSSFYLKLNTIYPIIEAKASFGRPLSNYAAPEVYYTSDETPKWTKIEVRNGSIDIPDNKNMFYLKIKAMNQGNTGANPYFGINGLSVAALLSTR